METYEEQQERLERNAAKAVWPDNLPAPKRPKLKLTGSDGNVFAVLGRAKRASEAAKWTDAQWQAFRTIAMAGSYDHALQACMKYFNVS